MRLQLLEYFQVGAKQGVGNRSKLTEYCIIKVIHSAFIHL